MDCHQIVKTYCNTVACRQAAADMDRHLPVLNRIVGQIWDSPVDLYALPDGIAKAITSNETLQASIKKYLL